MLNQDTKAARMNSIKPQISPEFLKAVGRASIPGPRVAIRRFAVVDFTPPAVKNFFLITIVLLRNLSLNYKLCFYLCLVQETDLLGTK